MIVVGVGCGPGMLTVDAMDKISSAKRIFGSKRAIDIARPHIPANCDVKMIDDYSRLNELPDDTVVLSTGDPMLAGLGHLGVEVVPGISSMQLAFSRLKLPLIKAVVVDAHSKHSERAYSEVVEELQRGKMPFVLTYPEFAVPELASMLNENGIDCKIAVCENLGYPNETISVGTQKQPPSPSSRLFSLIVVRM